MNREKINSQEKLREMLHFFLDEMGATQVELSQGMGVSRPLVIDFLSEKKEYLPVSSEGLVKLCENLRKHKPSKRKLKKKDCDDESILLRENLGEVGADELLESAGFLPDKTESIRVTPERFFQVTQIVALLELLEFEDLLSTTKEFFSIASDKLTIASTKLFDNGDGDDDALEALIKKLREPQPTLGLKLKLQVIKNLRLAQTNFRNGGKTKFSRKEAVSLFLSILIKEKMKNDPLLHARIKKLEFQTLSRLINFEVEYSKIYYNLTDIAYYAERELQTPGIPADKPENNQNNLSLSSLQPVIMAIATCNFGSDKEDSEPLEWIYTSSNTMVENAISACTLNLGLKEDTLLTISTNTLDSNVHSLVETTVILGEKQQYQGIWVDRDSMTVMLQAIVCAVKQWFADKSRKNELDSETYVSACRNLSDLRKRLIKVRKAFHNFQFLDKGCQISEIKKIADEAKQHLKDIPADDIYFTYRLNFFRCYCLAKRLELRLSIFQGNIINAKYLIIELTEALDQPEVFQLQVDKNELSPISALIHSEIYLYELSCGHNFNLWQNTQVDRWPELTTWKNKITKVINTKSCYKDAGLDVYESLSEIHGNAARIYFYISEDKVTLEEAAQNFLKAAHYALRIGLIQRASRWIALAGRVWVRLNNSELSLQAFKLSEKLAKTDLTTGHSHNFCQAVTSEINLLRGEYLLLIEDNEITALEHFIQALKGSVYLGLNRRICDSLFNISRCSEKLGNLSIQSGLSRVFPEEEKLIKANIKKLNPMSNHNSEKVLELLCNLYDRKDSPNWFQVRNEFSHLATQIWQTWHQDTSQYPAKTIHPIAEKIKQESWLSQIG